jgi:hypothetical protein
MSLLRSSSGGSVARKLKHGEHGEKARVYLNQRTFVSAYLKRLVAVSAVFAVLKLNGQKD